jgi:insertion element IS1 protein InsB
MDEQWGYVGAKSRQRWLFYAYDRLRKTVVAHVFGERTMATLGRLMSLLSPFDVVIWMTDGWPLYESRLKGKLHVISKRYTQRIERYNLNLRQHNCRRADSASSHATSGSSSRGCAGSGRCGASSTRRCLGPVCCFRGSKRSWRRQHEGHKDCRKLVFHNFSFIHRMDNTGDAANLLI